MEFGTESVEVEEICEDGNPVKKFKQIVGTYDPRFITDWKNDPNFKQWVEKTKKDGETATATVTTYQLDGTETTECIELSTNETNNQIEVKTIQKTIVANAIPPPRHTRPAKRQIRVMDPNLPAFVCTEHNENILLDCRYCRIASGFKKKSSQRIVQNDEISSSGKVTVAIPKRDSVDIAAAKNVEETEANREMYFANSAGDASLNNAGNRSVSSGKYVQKFRSEWLKLPEFKDWLIECKLSGEGDMSQAQCKFCGTLLVNNSNNLVRHAISKKHMKNMELENSDLNSSLGSQIQYQSPKTSIVDSKEEIFGAYIASELKRIKNKKTYEEVKWKILQTLQSAAEKEAEDQEKSAPE